MARKSSRKSRKARKTAASSRKKKPAEPKKVDFATEYRYVISDLKRFGILAVAMFATLIVLAFVVS